MAQFAELVFAYIDELSAASVAGHTDELSTSGRVRERYRERLGQHLLAGARDETLAAAAERADWTPPTTLTAVLLPVGAGAGGARVAERRTPCRSARTCPGCPARASPDRRTPCCWCRTSTGPAAGTCSGSSTAGRRWSARRGRGRRARTSYDRAVRTAGAAGRRGRAGTGGHRGPPRRAGGHAPTARRWPTCAPARSPRWPTCGPPPASGSRRRCASWLLHQGRRDAVAADLHVHAQTVRYRMGQLREAVRRPARRPGDGARAPAACALPSATPPRRSRRTLAPRGRTPRITAGIARSAMPTSRQTVKVAPRAADVPAKRRGRPRPARGRLGRDAARTAGDLAAQPASRSSGSCSRRGSRCGWRGVRS